MTSRVTLLSGFRTGQRLLPWIVTVVGLLLLMAIAVTLVYEFTDMMLEGEHSRGCTGCRLFSFLPFFLASNTSSPLP